MTDAWTAGALERIDEAEELLIAPQRVDGTLRREVPVWVVRVAEQVYVRTWYRRETGWFAHVLGSGRARVRVPGLEADITVEDVGEGVGQDGDGLRALVDDVYRSKYSRYGDASVGPMVADEAAATTLRLTPRG